MASPRLRATGSASARLTNEPPPRPGTVRTRPDVDQRSQRLADSGAADLKPAGLLGLGGEAVPRSQLAGGDGLHDREPHLVDRAHDGGGAEGGRRPPRRRPTAAIGQFSRSETKVDLFNARPKR